jgi:hypothetical protein
MQIMFSKQLLAELEISNKKQKNSCVPESLKKKTVLNN